MKVISSETLLILEAIFEQDFIDTSYGFRPNQSCHDALEQIDRIIMNCPVNFIVDMDISKFFDTVNHKYLMEFLRQRIVDSGLLQLISRFLKSGIMEEGIFFETNQGTPQGGVLSPVLANVYLHYVLDSWFETEVIPQLNGFAQYGFKCETFDFLGFTHFCDKTRRGKFNFGRKTSRKKFTQKMKDMNLWLKHIRNREELKEWWKLLAIKLLGHYQYYGMSGNARRLRNFYHHTVRLAFKWTNRRSQRKSYNWEQFHNFIQFNPLPKRGCQKVWCLKNDLLFIDKLK